MEIINCISKYFYVIVLNIMVSDKTLETANLKQGRFFILSCCSQAKLVLERHRVVESVMDWVNDKLKNRD